MSKLYIVPTPIGNLEDITFRAITILKSVQLILAEDTRKTIFLCKHFLIDTNVQSYHKDNEHKIVDKIVAQIQSGVTVALVSDAGTPAISDPGFLLVRACIKNDVEVECLPGATAFVPALVNAGFPTDRFIYEGFLPHQKGRQKRLLALQNEEKTVVFYESPYRLLKLLKEFIDLFDAERQVSVSRELTKKFEETKRGTATELLEYFSSKDIKGEFVVVLEGKK